MSAIEKIEFNEALGERYLAYALSTILSRSLPDVRDGLKPVHRRLLYAMHELKLNPQSSFKKSARVVGDVMGKFHPHGDASIYDALVRLAQDFSVRYPLIDGQGNFGNIDGDNPAAMRYTEARLTGIGALLLEGIDEETVDFTKTYDEESEEPLVFPACFPNLLANGSTGIAVGMATSIPPHNLEELCLGMMALLENPELSEDQLLEYIPGPDFPTGGILVESRESILQTYTTGRGSFRVRASYIKEELKGGGYQLVVTSIPYMVQKSKLIEKMAQLLFEKKLPLMSNFMDESSEDLRVVIEPKSRNIDPEMLMESLFKQTELESRFSLNMNVLSLGKRPEVLSLRTVLSQFLVHRFDILQKRTAYRLNQIISRLELLDGYLIVYLNLDEVIHIIREHDDPKAELMQRFQLTENQVEAVLNMRLRSLRKLQEIEIRGEHDKLSKEKEGLEKLLGSDKLQRSHLRKSFESLVKDFGKNTELGKRRTEISTPPKEITILDITPIEVEPVTIICSEKGWIRVQKGHVKGEDIKYKEGDAERFVIPCQSHQKILIFTKLGKSYTLTTDKLPGGRSQGDSLRLMVDMEPEDEILFVGAIPLEKADYLLINNKGKGFRIESANLMAQTRQGKQIFNISGNTEYVMACILLEKTHLAMIGTHRKLLIQPVDDIPFLMRGQGVTLHKYKEAEVSDILLMNAEDGLTYRRGLQVVKERDLLSWTGKRGAIGKLAPLGFPRSNKFNG